MINTIPAWIICSYHRGGTGIYLPGPFSQPSFTDPVTGNWFKVEAIKPSRGLLICMMNDVASGVIANRHIEGGEGLVHKHKSHLERYDTADNWGSIYLFYLISPRY